jgi:hypothetical protein
MSYAQLYFKKDIDRVSTKDIEQYFSIAKLESDKIEFKSDHGNEKPHEKENNILKSICAFLNSEGGLIIWGAPKGQPDPYNKKNKLFFGNLTPMETDYIKDSFINVVTNKITPSPNGIRIQQLKKDSCFIYLIEVEKSQYSPHQLNNTYYMRLDGQSIPAPHHYIEALFKKISFPVLESSARVIRTATEHVPGTHFLKIILMMTITNRSKLQNEKDLYVKCEISHCDFETAHDPLIKRIYQVQQVSYPKAKSLFFYGEEFVVEETIRVPKDRFNAVINIQIWFGGQLSPLRTSMYQLDVAEAYTKRNDIDLVKKENIYVYEIK